MAKTSDDSSRLDQPHSLSTGLGKKIREELNSEDSHTFWTATQAARLLGIDTWENYFERLKRGEDQWYFAMQSDDPERIDRVVQLAEQTLPLDELASGPSDLIGIGPEFKHHSALDFVLQDLQRFPGKGWRLIKTGLQSPVIRNRNMAVRALSAWDRGAWPMEAEAVLTQAIADEPDDVIRETMSQVLAGEESVE